MRLFFALMPDTDLEYNLCSIQNELKPGPGWHTVQPGNLHLTLAFLGEVHANSLGRLEDLLQELTLPWDLPEVLGGFPSAIPSEHPHALCWEWEESPIVEEIQANLSKVLKSKGFELEKRKFRPHVTLFRTKKGELADLQLDQLKGQVGGSFRSLALLSSKSSEQGSIYTILAQRVLGIDEDEWD